MPVFADPAAASLPLHIVAPETLAAFLAASPHADWLRATGFEAALGDLRLLPGPGGLSGAVAGLGTDKTRRRTRFGLAKAFAALPAGDWHLDGPLTEAQADEAALASLLAQYQFNRYRPGKGDRPQARIKPPAGWRPRASPPWPRESS